MVKTLGIGGIFLKTDDPSSLTEWYRKWLPFPGSDGDYVPFPATSVPEGAFKVSSPFAKDSDCFGNPDQIYMIKQKIPFARAFSILEYYMRKKNKITSMREILKKEQVNTTEFPDIATWVAKWGMEEV